MPIKVLMPALSPTMTEGKLANWLVKEGDEVSSGDVIAEIETDKATMEVEAVDEGIIGKILVEAGTDAVPVNDVIAVLLEEDEDASALDGFDTSAGGASPAPKEEKKEQASDDKTKSEKASSTSSTSKTNTLSTNKGGRVFASPLARRMAEQNNLDVSAIDGSGPKGRVVKADIEKALKNGTGKKGASPSKAASTGGSMPQGVDARAQADALGQPYEFEPANSVRQVIAKRLLESKQTVPHFYLSLDCELDALLALRKEVNADAEDYKVSVNDFVIRATAKALKDVPAANASWTGDGIIHYTDVDVSVAVASENGLITPIVKQADQKTIIAISKEMKDLADRARDGKLAPHEFQGGGFTISNLGMFGIKTFSAIINPPQSCILAIGAGEQRMVVKNGEPKVATVMTVTLSVDHRSVDGAVGAEFLAAFKKYIEAPAKILA